MRKNLSTILGVFVLSVLPSLAYAKEYVVQKGDNLTKICRENNVCLDDVVKANRIENPDLIKIGQKLEIPETQTCDAQDKPKQEEENPLIAYAEYTGDFEGRRSRVYDPNPRDWKPEPTIGIGHYMDRKDSRETFAKVLPEVNYDAVYNGKQELTNEQIDRLFSADILEYVERAKKLFPKFDSYPEYLRQALVDGCYRGDLSGSPATRKLINSEKFNEAAKEYLNYKQYVNAVKLGIPGIRQRMEKNRDAMLKYAGELSSE